MTERGTPATVVDRGIGDRIYEGSLIIELLRLRDAMRLFFRPVLRRYAITDQNWRLIKFLGENGPTDMTSLALGAVIPMASTSRIVTRMEANGLLRRVQDKSDGRQVLVKLTPKGQRVHAELAPQIRRIYAELSARLPPDALEQLHSVVVRLNSELTSLASGEVDEDPSD